MKKYFLLILTIMCIIMSHNSVFAGVTSQSVSEYSLANGMQSIVIPIVKTGKNDVDRRINDDIMNKVKLALTKDSHENDTLRKFSYGFYYNIISESDDYISMQMTGSVMNYGMFHPQHRYFYGIVYSKKTGNIVPLKDFVDISLSDINNELSRGNLYSMDGTRKISNTSKTRLREMPENYVIRSDGSVALIFDQYVLASYSVGPTSIDITSYKKKKQNIGLSILSTILKSL